MKLKKLAVYLKINEFTLRSRCIRLNISLSKEKSFTDAEIELIKSVNPKKEKPCKIIVLELFFTLKNNSVRNLSVYLKTSEKYIHDVIDEWLKNNGSIIIQSKL